MIALDVIDTRRPAVPVAPAPVPPPVLTIEELSKRYTRTGAPAVSGVNLSVSPGEIMAVVGESGCGKSTLLRMVAGLEVPTSGVIAIGGRTVSGGGAWVAPERREVGMVFQDFALFPHMTTEKNVMYGLRSLRRGERRARAAAMLELVGLSTLSHRFPHELSGGQQQRVALARALASQPRLLLLDEPFSNLDTALKRTLREELRDILQRAGTTTLLVVHDSEDVMILADRAAVMRDGRMLQEGDPESLYHRPESEYVAHFFGETNVLSGSPSEGGFQTPLGLVPCAAAATCMGAVRLCLRPEHLVLSSGSGDQAGQAAIVRRVHVAGMRRRIVVQLGNGPAGGEGELLVIHAGPEPRLAVGDSVQVLPRPDCVHVIGGQ